jgi:hypothetical protein
MSRWPDGQNPWSSLDLDFVSQPRNLKQRLGEADPPRIADFDQLRSNHDKPRVRAHIVATLAAFALSLAWLTLIITRPKELLPEISHLSRVG